MKDRGRVIRPALVLLTALYQCKKADGNGSGALSGLTMVFVGASISENWDFDHTFAGYDALSPLGIPTLESAL
jgi:hypothetical protein